MGKLCLSFALSLLLVTAVFARPGQKSAPAVDSAAGSTDVAETIVDPDKVIEGNLPDGAGQAFLADLRAKLSQWHGSVLQMSDGQSLGAYSTGNSGYDLLIVNSCLKHNIDPLLILAQMSQESTFNRKATSPKGACGLMQLTPATAARWGVRNIYSPQQNIEAGVKYMRWLLDQFNGDVSLALAAYNAGEGAVRKYGNQIPPFRETKSYVARITTRYAEITNPAPTKQAVDPSAIAKTF
jgi:soluble lytic murein transglycosylase-like protein